MSSKVKPQKFIAGALMYTLLFAGAKESITGTASTTKCGGTERWDQKVLIDAAATEIRETPHDTAIADLTAINTTTKENCYANGKPRMGIEKQVYTIRHCFISDVLLETDHDFHLVIEDGKGNTMIAEIPDPKCPDAASSRWINDFIDARDTMSHYANNYRHFLFTVTGVTFVDKAHGQTGKAPNSIELHPVIQLTTEKQINPKLKS